MQINKPLLTLSYGLLMTYQQVLLETAEILI